MTLVRLPRYEFESVTLSLSETVDWGVRSLGIPPMWKKTAGEGVKVGILDTGLASHPDVQAESVVDLTGSPWRGRDLVGHGTHVAGIVGAIAGNDLGVVGIAPRCILRCYKVLGDDGSGLDAWVARGIERALKDGVDVISMSLGSPRASREIAAALDDADKANVPVVCAAGNDGPEENTVNYPARDERTVAVAAVGMNDAVTRFSARGPEIDVAAPGDKILSCWLNEGYARLSGTSMAAPFATGVLALLISRLRNLGKPASEITPNFLRKKLRKTAKDLGDPGFDTEYGWGLINPPGLLSAEERAKANRWLEVHVPPRMDDAIGLAGPVAEFVAGLLDSPGKTA